MKMVLFNPHLSFEVRYYMGYVIRFWKKELPNIKTCPVPYVVFRVKT